MFDRTRISDPDHYAFQIAALRDLSSLPLHDKVTFFVGENGSGKSTLLEAIAIAAGLNAEGGSRNFNFATSASHSDKLHRALRLVRYHRLAPDAWFLRAESLFNVASEIDRLDREPAPTAPLINSYGGKSLHEQSHGEAFISLVAHRFSQGFYLLDEPESALSPQRQLEFLILMHQMVSQASQLIIATHSPMIMSYPDAWIYEFSQDGIERIAFEDTEHFNVTKTFLDNPSRMHRHLFPDVDQ
ncbi:MAG TPA: AAA family ATPase [Planctomycetaceae bacterium]|nr:AAA family ATPase [Planctomycetaceae bacterium]